MASELLAITNSERHPGFFRHHKIISQSWYIYGLRKLLYSFIWYYPQYLILQTKKYAFYGSLQPIQFLFILFFTLKVYFILALPLNKSSYNALMLVIHKFFKKITLIKEKNTWTAKQLAHTFFCRLDFINWRLLRELITDCDSKLLDKFWTTLFNKLGVKFFYCMTYHPQTNGSSQKTNQTVEITFRFFVYALQDLGYWPQILSFIQSIINNTSSSTTNKTTNEILFCFAPRQHLDFLLLLTTLNILVAQVDASKTILFSLLNQIKTYNCKYQSLFIKIKT